ncbi:MAG: hypothetical protein WAS54_04645, partial [Scrofimicrobium sp.]
MSGSSNGVLRVYFDGSGLEGPLRPPAEGYRVAARVVHAKWCARASPGVLCSPAEGREVVH